MESRVLPPKVRPPEPEVEEIGTKSRVYSPDVSAFGRPADEEGAAPDGSLADFGFAQGPAQPPAQQPVQPPDAGKVRAQGQDLVPPGVQQPNAPRRGLLD